MPARQVSIDGERWEVYPSGYLTPSLGDEFGVLFVRRDGERHEVRVTRFSPAGTRSRERALAELDDAALVAYFRVSQSGARAPETGYRA